MRFMLAIYLAVAILAAVSPSVPAQGKGEAYVEGELLVRFAKGVSPESAEAFHQQIGAAAVEKLGDLGWERVSLPAGLSVTEAVKRYSGSMDVAAVQPNFYYRLMATPNDAQYATLWGLPKIAAPAAWDVSTGSSSVVVAVIDTGIRYTHEDLAANIWTNSGEIAGNGMDDDGNGYVDDFYGYDFRYNDPDPNDENGHGTHTAGTIGAVGNNTLGVVGVNWNVKLMAIKIYSPSGSDTTSAMLINAYNYVRIMKQRGVNIRVTNNSYGGCAEACGYDQATKDAIDALGNAGILNVFAAGNSGANNDVSPFYPANYTSPSVISVASSTSTDTRSSFSNFGAVSVDLAAPGSGILSTYRNSDASYGSLSGTSMATPHVAGAAALLAAHNPSLSVASLKATLLNTVDVLSAWNGVVKTGGRLNVANALTNQTVCTATPVQSQISMPTKGGVFSLPVGALSNCDYSVRSNANWIKVTSGETATGGGNITIRVLFNHTVSRSGTLNIGGQQVTVTQTRGGNL